MELQIVLVHRVRPEAYHRGDMLLVRHIAHGQTLRGERKKVATRRTCSQATRHGFEIFLNKTRTNSLTVS